MTSGHERATAELARQLNEAEGRAWDSLARYKFHDFSRYATLWISINKVGNFKRANPWRRIVEVAREEHPLKNRPKAAPLLTDGISA